MKLIFWTFYSWAKKLNLDSTPEWTALATLSFLIYINTVSTAMLISILFKKKGLYNSIDFLWHLVFLAIITSILYFKYCWKNKYLFFEKEFSDNQGWFVENKNLLTWGYTLVSLLALLLVGTNFTNNSG